MDPRRAGPVAPHGRSRQWLAAGALLIGGGALAVALAAPGLLGRSAQLLLVASYAALVPLALALLREDRAGLVHRLQQAHRGAAEQAATLGTLLDTVDVGVVACDADGHLTLFNRATREFHGMPEDPGLDPQDWADRYRLYAADGAGPLTLEQVPLYRALVHGAVHDETITIASDSQEPRTLRCDGRRLVDADGRTLGAVVAMKDVTAARTAQRALAEREQRFRAAFHDSPTPITYLGLTGTVQDVNAAFRRFLGVATSRLVQTPLSTLVHPEDQDLLDEALQGEGTGQDPVEVRLRRADQTYLWCQVATTRSATLDGQPYLLAQFLDITARKQHEQVLEAAAQRDPLTGLGNRSALGERLSLLLQGSGPGADGPRTTVLYIDLDGFKAVNDTYGHDAGDAVLVEVATRLQSAVRPDDLVARIGGDEFVVVCAPGAAHELPEDAAALVERLEQALSAPVAHDGYLLSVGASIGAVVAGAGRGLQDVLEDADRAMYRRKKQRRHHPVQQQTTGGSFRRSASSDAALAVSVGTAEAQGRLHLLYQPVYDLHTGLCVGAEALLRMTDTGGATITPDRFIPVAETHGHIARIGRWVITEALERAAEWKRTSTGDRDFLIGVNVSTLQLNDPGLVGHLRDVLLRTGLPAAAVGLEITESRLLPDTPEVHRTLSALHELGVRVTVDDFGTGFANLGYLATFPFDTLKVDRTYVSHLTEPTAAGRLAQGVFALARSTGMVVVAEGIETVEERDAVLAMGCHLAQGFLFARPLQETDLLALLQDPRPAAVHVPAPRS